MNKIKPYLPFLILFLSILFYNCKEIDCEQCKASGKITKEFVIDKQFEEPVEYVEEVRCTRCRGRGEKFCDYQFVNTGLLSMTQYECDRGRYRAVGAEGVNGGQLSGRRCDACRGAGYVKCKICKGYGTRKLKKTKYETITKAVKVDSLIIHEDCEGTGKVMQFF